MTNLHIIKICIILVSLVFTLVGLIDYIEGLYELYRKDDVKLTNFDMFLSIVYLILGVVICGVIVVLSYRLFMKNLQ